MTIVVVAFIALAAIALIGSVAMFRALERERVTSCLLDGICPACGKATIVDTTYAHGSRWAGYDYEPAIECSSCNVKRPLPERVRDARIKAAREEKRLQKERAQAQRWN